MTVQSKVRLEKIAGRRRVIAYRRAQKLRSNPKADRLEEQTKNESFFVVGFYHPWVWIKL